MPIAIERSTFWKFLGFLEAAKAGGSVTVWKDLGKICGADCA